MRSAAAEPRLPYLSRKLCGPFTPEYFFTLLIIMATKHEFNVEMTCEGCSGAVSRILGKTEGIEKFDIDLEHKKVFVTSAKSADELLAIIKKAGKETSYVGAA